MSCKKICLSGNCPNEVTTYANFSRYHGFCSNHRPSSHPTVDEILCMNCKNSIKVIINLPLSDKKLYKLSLSQSKDFVTSNPLLSNKSQIPTDLSTSAEISQDLSQNQAVPSWKSPPTLPNPINPSTFSQTLPKKCSYSDCPSKDTKKFCEHQEFCEIHLKLIKTCNFCRCNFCGTFQVMIRPCGLKICEKCEKIEKIEKIGKCCFLCCLRTEREMEECGHFLCDDHADRMCLCFPCGMCGEGRVKRRLCKHVACESCEVDGKCVFCVSGYCEGCGDYKVLDLGNCKVHYFCRDCDGIMNECHLCKKTCCRCFKGFSDYHVGCSLHPLCLECRAEFKGDECVYCSQNYEKFVCQGCGFTYGKFFNHPCGHRLCKSCSILPCGHESCLICYTSMNICFSCHTNYFCKSCKKIDCYNKISCEHGLCLECGIKVFDAHYVCSQCHSSQFFFDGKCLKCENSICGQCMTPKVLKALECEHKICDDCFLTEGACIECKKPQICQFCDKKTNKYKSSCEHIICDQCLNQINKPICLKCSKNEEDFHCSFCLYYYEDVKVIKCGHKACINCLKINNDEDCELCGLCEACLKIGEKASLNCQHSLCINCAPGYKTGSCSICSGELIYCSKCSKYSSPFICINNHSGCKICSKILLETRGITCEKCTYKCSYCQKPEGFLKLPCGHYICKNCHLKFQSSQTQCLKCDKNSKNICKRCERVFESEQLKTFECGHQLCTDCFFIKKCFSCSENVCPVCDDNRRKIEKNEEKNDFSNVLIREGKSCTHTLCHACKLFCEKCGKNICPGCRTEIDLNNQCPHKLCLDCIIKYKEEEVKCEYYQSCKVCKTAICTETGEPCQHENCLKFKSSSCINCNPSKLCINCFENITIDKNLCENCSFKTRNKVNTLYKCESCKTIYNSQFEKSLYSQNLKMNETSSKPFLLKKSVSEKNDHSEHKICLGQENCTNCDICKVFYTNLSTIFTSCPHNLCEKCLKLGCSLCQKPKTSEPIQNLKNSTQFPEKPSNSRLPTSPKFLSSTLQPIQQLRNSTIVLPLNKENLPQSPHIKKDLQSNEENSCIKCKKIMKIENLCQHYFCKDCRKKNECGCSCDFCEKKLGIVKHKCGHSACDNHSIRENCKECYKLKCICKKSNIEKFLANCGKHLFCLYCLKKECILCKNEIKIDEKVEIVEKDSSYRKKYQPVFEEKLRFENNFKSDVLFFNYKSELKSKITFLLELKNSFIKKCEMLTQLIKSEEKLKLEYLESLIQNYNNLLSKSRADFDFHENIDFPMTEKLKNAMKFDTVKIFEVINSEIVDKEPAPQPFIDYKFLCMNDESLVLSLNEVIKVIDISSKENFFSSFDLNGHQKEIKIAKFQLKNSLISGSQDGSIRLWDLKEQRLIENIIENQNPLKFFNIFKERLVFITETSEIKEFSFDNRTLNLLYAVDEPLDNCVITSDLNNVIYSSKDSIKKLNIRDKSCQKIETKFQISSIFLTDEFIYCSCEDHIKIISIKAFKVKEKIFIDYKFSLLGLYRDTRLVLSYYDGKIELFDCDKKRVEITFQNSEDEGICKVWSQNNKIARLNEGSLLLLEIN